MMHSVEDMPGHTVQKRSMAGAMQEVTEAMEDMQRRMYHLSGITYLNV
jgi:hypothetical protein